MVVSGSKPTVPVSDGLAGGGAIEIEAATGVRMRITGAVDAATLKAAVAALLDAPHDPLSVERAGMDCDGQH